MLCQSTVSIGVHNFPYVFVLLRPTVPSKFRPHFNIPFRKHGAAPPLFFLIFHLLRVSRCIFEFSNKKVPKKKTGLSGEKTVWQKCFFFQFFPSPEGNIAHILGGVSFVKMLRFFPGFDAYFEFFAFLPRSARL